MANLFINLEDEIKLRLSARNVYKLEGLNGIYKCLGELSESMTIIAEVVQEILEEENRKKGN